MASEGVIIVGPDIADGTRVRVARRFGTGFHTPGRNEPASRQINLVRM